MKIEKPISTIRKAIQGSAEKIAREESLEKPEKRHYEKALAYFKLIRAIDPQRLEHTLPIMAKDQDMKNELGKELHEVFVHAWMDATNNIESEIKDIRDRCTSMLSLSIEEVPRPEIDKALRIQEECYMEEKVNEVKSDPRIIIAFAGKEKLLDKALELSMASSLELLEMERVNSTP